MSTSDAHKEPVAAIILAAGKGTRMKSEQHKVLHKIAGRAMVEHVFAGTEDVNVAKRVLIVGDKREQLERYADKAQIVVQEPQLGTGHAVMQARSALEGFEGIALILYGDVPLIRPETLGAMIQTLSERAETCAMVVLGFQAQDPGHYGRLITRDDGTLIAIREWKDATSSEKQIKLCNSGVMAVRTPLLFEMLAELTNENAAGEYYLTDIVAIADKKGMSAFVVEADEQEVLGVNSRLELAQLETLYQRQRRAAAMAEGATLIDPDSVFFSHDTILGRDVVIEPNVFFGPGIKVGNNVVIHAFSHLEGCMVADDAQIGPFARLRPGADIGAGAKVGNFVEIKKAALGAGAKANHLSYIGDAEVGAGANIGAGTITCNYDGFLKYRTEIGAGAFIGSNSALVAPVKIGDGAIIGAGSVITGDVENDALAVARGKEIKRAGWAKAFRERMAKAKADLKKKGR